MAQAGGAPNPNNGMAVAALVLGILTFVCLGPIAGILAIIFGFLGMKKAKEIGGTGKGMALAGLILGAVGTVLSVIVFIVFVVAAGTATVAIMDATGAVDPANYSIKVTTCETDSAGYPLMAGTIQNKTSSVKSYMFDYEFRDGNNVLIDSGISFLVPIPKNGTIPWDVNSFKSSKAKVVKCEITQVNNWFN